MFFEIAKKFNACTSAQEILSVSDNEETLQKIFATKPNWALWARFTIPLKIWRENPTASRILFETSPISILIGFTKIWSFSRADLSGALGAIVAKSETKTEAE